MPACVAVSPQHMRLARFCRAVLFQAVGPWIPNFPFMETHPQWWETRLKLSSKI